MGCLPLSAMVGLQISPIPFQLDGIMTMKQPSCGQATFNDGSFEIILRAYDFIKATFGNF